MKKILGLMALLISTNLFAGGLTEMHGISNIPEKGTVALTFDDGPNPTFTPQILAILKKYNIKATFFVVGMNAKH